AELEDVDDAPCRVDPDLAHQLDAARDVHGLEVRLERLPVPPIGNKLPGNALGSRGDQTGHRRRANTTAEERRLPKVTPGGGSPFLTSTAARTRRVSPVLA